uniref:Uncharacterized protein LOC108037595 n=1 Tax=Drosophila rhopaloa TaxID=1041015 RepID=A0A6P4E038_DRORH
FSNKITAFQDRDSLEPRPGNKYRQRRIDSHLEEQLTPEKRIAKFPLLGPLCLTPRYLRMTPSEFRRCCDRLELLPPTEISLITDALEGKKLKNLTDQQAELLEKFRQPRAEYARMPVHLSDRSSPKNYPKKMRLAHDGRPTEEGCWEKVGMNCLRIFVCIFD